MYLGKAPVNVQTLSYDLPVALSGAPHLEHQSKRSQFAMVDLELFNRSPAWQAEVDEQLADLMSLRKGWNGPTSGPIALGMASYIRSVLKSVMQWGTPVPSFVPGHGGAVQLEWHQGGLDVELMIYRPLDAELSVHFHDGRGPVEEKAMSINFDDLSKVLSELS